MAAAADVDALLVEISALQVVAFGSPTKSCTAEIPKVGTAFDLTDGVPSTKADARISPGETRGGANWLLRTPHPTRRPQPSGKTDHRGLSERTRGG